MSTPDVYAVCVEWAHQVLNPEFWATRTEPIPDPLNIPIIRARQNSPAPGDNYIAIPIAPQTDTQGHAYRLPYDGDTQKQAFIQESEAELTLREVGGVGNNLRKMIDYLDFQEIKSFFSSKQVSVLRWGNVMELPRNEEEEWEEEWILPVTLLIAGQSESDTTYIENVDITPNIT